MGDIERYSYTCRGEILKEVLKVCDSENRSTANAIETLLLEAIKARKEQQLTIQ